MSARIGTGRIPGSIPYYVDLTAKRGTTVVPLVDDGPFVLPFTMGVGLLAWTLQTPSAVPTDGDWSFDCPILSEFSDQVVGVAISGSEIKPLRLAAGYLTTPLTIGASQLVTLRGMVVN